MMTAKFMLSKRSALKFTVALLFHLNQVFDFILENSDYDIMNSNEMQKIHGFLVIVQLQLCFSYSLLTRYFGSKTSV